MKSSALFFWALTFLSAVSTDVTAQSVDTQLYMGEGDNQPLIVAFGGGDGGNSWTSDRVSHIRERLIDEGYAFLAIGYFGTENTPEVLDRISLDTIHEAIVATAEHPGIDENRIAALGISKGAELALLLASYFEDIKGVIAMVSSHCVFPAHTATAATSSWTIDGAEVPFVPMREEALPALAERDLLSAFTVLLENEEAVEEALIRVEDIKGPVLLLSAINDEQWPSTEMSNAVMERLKEKQFPYAFQHVITDGGHFEVFDHVDSIYLFLDKNFPAN